MVLKRLYNKRVNIKYAKYTSSNNTFNLRPSPNTFTLRIQSYDIALGIQGILDS